LAFEARLAPYPATFIAAPAALIGIAEKGYLSLELSVETAGGHSSIPPTDTAIGIISRALLRLEATRSLRA